MPTASKYENKYLDIARKDLSTAYNFYDITNILEWVFNMSTVAYKEELYSYINKTADTFRNDPNSFSSIWGLICIFRDLPWAITDEFLVKPENKDIQRALLKYENNIDTLINIDNFIVDGNKLFSLDDEKEISELLTKIEPINDKLTEYDIKKNKLDKKEIKEKFQKGVEVYEYTTLSREEVERLKYVNGLTDKEIFEYYVNKYGEYSKHIRKQKEATVKMYNSYTSYVAQKAEKIQESVIQKILANSSITQEQADEFVENYITFSEETSEVLHKNGQSIEELKKDIAEFYRLTNGNLPPTTVYAENKKGRSFQEGLSITLLKKWNNAKFYSKWTLFHELGHVIEEDKRLTIITSAFVKKRATSNKLFSLKELTGLNYKSSERTYLDHFADHYVGKPYEGGNSEVLSMGIQTLADKDSFAKGLKDYSHMAMVFGIMQKKWHSIPNKYLEYKKKNEFPFLDKLIKKEKWEKAIDKAITQDFKEKLAMPLGVDGIHVEHSYNKYNIKELRLIYNSGKKSKTVTYSDPVGFRDAYRIAYLIIAYKRGLLPYNKEKYNINSPDYFFVNYEIFFESPLGFCSTDKLPEIR